jgi:hypothetical protein
MSAFGRKSGSRSVANDADDPFGTKIVPIWNVVTGLRLLAATRPVMGSRALSLERLPDIVARQKINGKTT